MFDSYRQILEDKLWSETIVHPIYGCYLWCGTKDTVGYGRITFDIINTFVHKLSAYLFLGMELGTHLQVGHKTFCSYKNCWRPEHLHIITCSENLLERKEYKIGSKLKIGGLCYRGHLLTKKTLRKKFDQFSCRICDREDNTQRRKLKREEALKNGFVKLDNGHWQAPEGFNNKKPIWKLLS